MPTKLPFTKTLERLKIRLSKTFPKIKPKTTRPDLNQQPLLPEKPPPPTKTPSGSPNLRSGPVWSEGPHISLPTGVDISIWEPYDSTSNEASTARNNPAYSEMSKHRRRSEGQYIAHIGLELEFKDLAQENARLERRISNVQFQIEVKKSLIEDQAWQIQRLTRLKRFSLGGVAMQYLQTLRSYYGKKRDMDRLRREFVAVEEDASKWKQSAMEWENFARREIAYVAGQEEVIRYLMDEKEKLRKELAGMKEDAEESTVDRDSEEEVLGMLMGVNEELELFDGRDRSVSMQSDAE